MRKFVEEVSFLDQWHFIDDVYPEDGEAVWFTANGKMYVGTYNELQGAFIMADGEGIGLNDVQDWKTLSKKQIASYPKEKDIVAAEIPGLPSLVMGIFTDHAIDEDTGDEVSAIFLDDVYFNLPEFISWKNVFSWYLLPESPAERVVIKNINTEVLECPVIPVDKEIIDATEYASDYAPEENEEVEEVEEVTEAPEETEVSVEKEPIEKESGIENKEEYTSEIKKAGKENLEEITEGRKKTKEVADIDKNLDENNPALPIKARRFAKWWYHEMLGEEADPNFKQKYKGKVIDAVDEIFDKDLGPKYTTKHDVGFLYDWCSPEAKKKLSDIMHYYKAKAAEGWQDSEDSEDL